MCKTAVQKLGRNQRRPGTGRSTKAKQLFAALPRLGKNSFFGGKLDEK